MENDLLLSSQTSQPTLSLSPESKRKQSILIAGLIFAILIFASASFWLFFTNSGKRQNPLLSEQAPSNSSQSNDSSSVSFKQWVNCDDVREVIEEGNLLYLACLGGVVIADKTSGKVIDQITMRDGLRSATATSIEKGGDILYIGTQDGFAIFNTKTRVMKTISEPEGLISGANIELALDGDTLWVGTFEGLGKYNIKSGKIENFTTELADNSITVSSSLPLLTKESLYFIVVANVNTSGSVARLDRETQTWERFGPSAFGMTGEYARIDMFDMVEVGQSIFITDHKNIWEAENKSGSTWKRRDDIINQLNEQGFTIGNINFINLEDNLGIIAQNRVYKLKENALTQRYPTHDEGENVLAGIHDGYSSVQNGKIWVMVGRYQEPWLRWVSTKDWKSGVINMAERPKRIDSLKVLINDTVITTGDGAIWSYNFKNNIFKKIVALKHAGGTDDSGLFIFRPVSGTSKVFVVQQSCGMGCGGPEVFLYDYAEKTIKPIELSSELKTALGGQSDFGWATLSFQGLMGSNKQVLFSAGGEYKAILDLNTLAWTLEKTTSVSVQDKRETCNLSYTFTNNIFSNVTCNFTLQSANYGWEILEKDRVHEIYQVDNKTHERVQIVPPMDQIGYSPFDDWTFPYAVSKSVVYEGKLWLGSTRGLSMYNPDKKTWQLYAQKDGLLSNEGVTDFVVGDRMVWVVTAGGGLSQIPLKD